MHHEVRAVASKPEKEMVNVLDFNILELCSQVTIPLEMDLFHLKDTGALYMSAVKGSGRIPKPECCVLKSEKCQSNTLTNQVSLVARQAH